MFDSGWAEANDAVIPAKDADNFATLNTNGTAALMVTKRQPGLKTVLEPFGGWWGDVEHNVMMAEFTPIPNPATAIAALLSGDVDLINPLPIQDAARLSGRSGIEFVRGIEVCVIMLGMKQDEDTLAYCDEGAANPFLDQRVRAAMAYALNVSAILQTMMRGNAEPASQPVSPAMRGYSDANAPRPAYDPDMARELLAAAGYANGFSFGLKCPSDRGLNDEAVCQAVVGMLTQVGVTVELEAMPVQTY